jgi:hypothetical protein
MDERHADFTEGDGFDLHGSMFQGFNVSRFQCFKVSKFQGPGTFSGSCVETLKL